MKVAVIGSRSLQIRNLEEYLPKEVSELISGGAKGVEQCARAYAQKTGLPLKEFLPDYESYGRNAPLRRNLQIIGYADLVLAFWDGHSKGTQFVIDRCHAMGKPIQLWVIEA